MSYTFYLHFIYIFIYILYASYVHLIYIIYTFYVHLKYILYKHTKRLFVFYVYFKYVPDMFRTCSKKNLGSTMIFSKSFGDLWAMFWHHPWCLRAG